MKLLNDEMLCDYVNRPDPLLVKGLKTPVGFDKDSPVQPSSIDLHIGSIYVPGTKHGEDGSEDKALTSHTLGPGQTALVTTLETLNLPNNVAAIGFPPSRISAQGILMTNPGHVDPG
jgi:deoxycytidine triphosphate deaminase